MQSSKNFPKFTEEEKLELFEVNDLEPRIEMWANGGCGVNDFPLYNPSCNPIPNPSCGSPDLACGPEPIP